MQGFGIFVVIGVAVFLYYFFKALSDGPPPDARPRSIPSGREPPRIKGNGRYSVVAVGESFYKPALHAIFGVSEEDGGEEKHLDGVLVLEDDNPHDKNAVAVTLMGKKVAHLSREVAADFRKAIARDGLSQWKEFAVGVEVWVSDDPEDHYSVRVDLPETP